MNVVNWPEGRRTESLEFGALGAPKQKLEIVKVLKKYEIGEVAEWLKALPC